MSDQTRLKNAKGQWLEATLKSAESSGVAWLSASLLRSLQEAAQNPKAGAELKKLAELTQGARLLQGPNFEEPYDAHSEALYAQWSVKTRAKEEASWSANYSHLSGHRREAHIERALRKGREQFQPVLPMSWLFAPAPYSIAWTTDPGKAAFFEGLDGVELKARCERLVAISALLPKALKNAHALKTPIDPRAMPATHKLLPGVALVASGEVEAFNPASEYLTRECYALYVERAAEKGFVTHKHDIIKPDLGSARLFPTLVEAERSGKTYYRNYAVVTVDIAPKSFQRRGNPGDLTDLEAAISAKEALEIDLALKTADIERLRREIQSREAEPAPAPKPAHSARSRL